MAQLTYTLALSQSAVVLQIGEHSIKAGLSCEQSPRLVVPSPLLSIVFDKAEKADDQSSFLRRKPLSSKEYELLLHPVLNEILANNLLAHSNETSVILVEHDLFPTSLRKAIVTLLFKYYNIGSITFLSEMTSILYLSDSSYSGLVIDVGFTETRILPVCFGLPLRDAYMFFPVGSHHINIRLCELLNELSPTKKTHHLRTLAYEDLERIKILSCYVKCELNMSFPIVSSQAVEIACNASDLIEIPADARWKAAEVLFEKSILTNYDSLIETVAAEIRQQVVSNILLCGGAACLRGFKYRFAAELKEELSKSKDLRNAGPFARINNYQYSPLTAQWLGGAIFAAISLDGLATSSKYDKLDLKANKKLPDWCVSTPITESLKTYKLMEKLNSAHDSNAQLTQISTEHCSELA